LGTVKLADAPVNAKVWVPPGGQLNVAVTVSAAATVVVHAPVPVQPPPVQPPNSQPESGVAVSVTVASRSNTALHVPGHVTPPGAELIVPDPGPSIATVNVKLVGAASGIVFTSPQPTRTSTARELRISILRSAHRAVAT
jgi:hypothetical protein